MANWADVGNTGREVRLAQVTSPGSVATPDHSAEITRDLTISLKDVVNAGCEPSNEQLSKLMDNPVGNLVLVFNQFDWTRIKGPAHRSYQGCSQVFVHADLPAVGQRALEPDQPSSRASGECARKQGRRRLFGLSPSEVISDPDFPGLLAAPFDRTTGLGDLTYIGVLSPKEPIKTESTGGLLV